VFYKKNTAKILKFCQNCETLLFHFKNIKCFTVLDIKNKQCFMQCLCAWETLSKDILPPDQYRISGPNWFSTTLSLSQTDSAELRFCLSDCLSVKISLKRQLNLSWLETHVSAVQVILSVSVSLSPSDKIFLISQHRGVPY
jgi:hypothetical protein